MKKTIIKRILLGVLLSPIVIPVFIFKVIMELFILIMFGVEYVLTGKYNQDDGGWQ